MSDIVIAGAGMAGLVAASQARALGAEPAVHERAARPGGSMLLSSGVIWRHRDFARFRAECPGGDAALQRLVFDRLDGDLEWLEGLGAPEVSRDTGNPLTTGVRFDPRGLTDALAAAAGPLRSGSRVSALPEVPLVLATGGFAGSRSLVRAHVTPEADALLLRAAPLSAGDGLELGLAAGGSVSAGMDEIYARAMPAPPARVGPSDFVALSQLYARHAVATNARGERFESRVWSEIDVAQWMARQPGARATFSVPVAALRERVRERTVGEMVAAAEAAGASVTRRPGWVDVSVVAGITTTLGGLRVDTAARAAPGVYACGADAGGIATGGYASGLAAALVLGRIAAESAVREA